MDTQLFTSHAGGGALMQSSKSLSAAHEGVRRILRWCRCFVEDLHADISVKTADGMTALQIAGAGDKLDIVQYLSAMPGQLAASDSVSGKNSLHTAASRGCFDTVKFLVESEQVRNRRGVMIPRA
jgi:ankyrin repeat protein